MKLKLYQPHANQVKIHESTARYRVVVAGRRFGKSALALNEALARAFQVRDQIIWIILPLFKQAKEIYWIDPDIVKYFMPLVQNGLVKLNNSELSLHVKSTNSWIRLKGSDNYEGLRGSGIDLIVWDEVADVKELAFEVIKPSLADSPDHKMLYIGTPKGINWFHDFALNGDHKGIIPNFGKTIQSKKDWQTWHFTSYDNLAWEEGSRDRRKFVEFINQQKQELTERGKKAFFDQEYLALFDQSIGQFYTEFDIGLHVCDPIFPTRDSILVGGMDWGRSDPFSLHLTKIETVVCEGEKFSRATTFLEIYGTDKMPKEWGRTLKDKLEGFGLTLRNVSWIRCDNQIFNIGLDNSKSISDQFADCDESFRGLLQPASKERVGGWENLHNWLSMAPDGKPYWQITKNCENLIRTLPLLTHDENKVEDVDQICEDHSPDDQRYQFKHLKWIDASAQGAERGKTGIQLVHSQLLKDKTAFDNDKEEYREVIV